MTYWIVFIIGNLLCGVLSAATWSNRENILLRFLGLIVPLGFGAWFWYYRLNSDFLQKELGNISTLFNSGSNELAGKIAEIILTAVAVTLISKFIGFILVRFFGK